MKVKKHTSKEKREASFVAHKGVKSVEVERHAFLTSALDGQLHALITFSGGKSTLYP
jgi:hypothetical protein